MKINELAEKYSRTPAQVILCHIINLGVSVIPKSNNLKRIEENFDCLFDIEVEDHQRIRNLMGVYGEKSVRTFEPRNYVGFDIFNEEVEEP